MANKEPIKLRTGDIAYIVLEQIFYFHGILINGVFDVRICGGYGTDLFARYLLDFSYVAGISESDQGRVLQKKT